MCIGHMQIPHHFKSRTCASLDSGIHGGPGTNPLQIPRDNCNSILNDKLNNMAGFCISFFFSKRNSLGAPLPHIISLNYAQSHIFLANTVEVSLNSICSECTVISL